MLVIRDGQLGKIEKEIKEDQFKKRLFEAMPKAWLAKCAALGENGLKARIDSGIKKALSQNIQKHDNITRYIHLMFLLGREDFDTAPKTSWAGQILAWENASEEFRLAAVEKRAKTEFAKI